MSSPTDRYEPVIGLEVHTHLRTRSKLFSPAPVSYGDAPNHNTHFVDLALPGVLPVLNAEVIDLAIRLGLATNASVRERSVFSRKNYFYPDLPKGYQISQYEEPVVEHGWIEVEIPPEAGSARSAEGSKAGAKGEKGKKKEKGKQAGPRPDAEPVLKRIGITRAHLEEDAGKSIHDMASAGGDESYIDLNRAGVPLLEIVSEPDMRSAAEAVAYLRALRSILRYIGVSDADMEKGQFRCDANVSLRVRGAAGFGTRTEIKNLNSFASVEAAIKAEIVRQAEILDDGGEVVQATMGFDPVKKRTKVQRLKENADDYRYFDDPDLIPLVIDGERIEAVRKSMPELPAEKRARFESQHGLSRYDAGVLTSSRTLADYFEAAVDAGAPAKTVANWIARDVTKELKERAAEIEDMALPAEGFAKLVMLVEDGRLTARSAQDLLPELLEHGGDPEAIMTERGLEAVSDAGLIDAVVDEVIASNADGVESVRAGDDKPLNFLMGQVMKATQGKANPGEVRKALIAKIRSA